MYNRYIRSDTGVYQRVSSEDPNPPSHNRQDSPEASNASPSGHAASAPSSRPEKRGLLSDILGKLRLDEIDTGDLLLLVILFLLFRDGEDEELLIALGLLLIL